MCMFICKKLLKHNKKIRRKTRDLINEKSVKFNKKINIKKLIIYSFTYLLYRR